ncbi:MAG TPA: hypothetical protein VN694_03750 [Caulobacteraceae bacterium]|nr:hypothetical protein [Caulobacteraceae bacterium]
MRDAEAKPRKWVRRSRGRRSTDSALRLETVLGAGVILAWTWGVYEVTLLFLK